MKRRHLALLLAALALAACGDDDNDGNGNGNEGGNDQEEAGPTPAATAEAKSGARNVVSHIETCYAETQDYTECDEPARLRDAQVALGNGEGQTEVTADSSSSYTVIARPEGGGEFRLSNESGAMTRECEPRDIPGCTNGRW
jgi:hypothetical protein